MPGNPRTRSEFLLDQIIKLNACNADTAGLLAAGNLDQAESVLWSVIHDVKAALAAAPAAAPGDGKASASGADPMTVDDIDALLANAKIVKEPSARDLLRQFGGSVGNYGALVRYRAWREDSGHRQICPECNTAFIRNRHNARRCTNCQRKFKCICAGCGQQFSATNYMLKRCPPCRAEWLKRPRGQLEQERRACDRCGEPFTPRSWNAKYCVQCAT